MGKVRSRGTTAFAALLALVAAPVAVIGLSAAPAGAVDVTTLAEYLDAFDDPGDVEINLLNDLTLAPCPATGAARAQPGTTLTVHGNGHTITGCTGAGTFNHLVEGDASFDGLSLVDSDSVLIVDGDLTLREVNVSTAGTTNGFGVVAQGSFHMTATHVGPVTAPVAVAAVIGVGPSNVIEGSTIGPASGNGVFGLELFGNSTVTDSLVTSVHGSAGGLGVLTSPNGPTDNVSFVRSTITDSDLSQVIGARVDFENSTYSNNRAPLILVAIEGGSVVYSDIVENDGLDEGSVSVPAVELPEGLPAGIEIPAVQALEVGAEQAGVQLLVVEATFHFFGTVVALPVGRADANCEALDATLVSSGYNFSDDETCGFTSSTDRQDAGDPLLGPLGDNGGPTPTLLPLTGSPLINAIPVADCQVDGAAGITTDQRGLPRPAETGCEIGSVEIQPPPIVLEPTFTG